VTTRGKYYPDIALATERDPPLYLHITSKNHSAIERASRMIQDLIDRDLGSLVDERRFRRTDERDEFGRRKWPEERVPINMESIRGFNVRAQIVGPSVQETFFVANSRDLMSNIFPQKHVHEFKSKGVIPDSRNPLQVKNLMNRHIYISRNTATFHVNCSGPDEVELARAKAMAIDLVETVRQAYEAHRNGVPAAAPPEAVHYQPQQTPSQIAAPPSASPPPGALSYGGYGAAPGAAPGTAPGADPYAAYGGYQQYQQSCTRLHAMSLT
jgi:hypothetical protein